jgi:hypothetical protein
MLVIVATVLGVLACISIMLEAVGSAACLFALTIFLLTRAV